jgi:hypothetical protein
MAVEMVAIASALIACLFGYLATHLEKKHPALQFFFLVMSVSTVIFTFVLMSTLATSVSEAGIAQLMDSMFRVNIIVLIVVILYFLLNIIKEVLLSFVKK